MKKTFKALKFSTVLLLLITSFIACDKEFSVIESDVLGNENANFYTDSLVLPISAYNKKLEALQINSLPSNLLGVFNDLEYGKTTASIVTQLTPASFDEDFDLNPEIDSVVINIPYFNTVTGIDPTNSEASTYALDSIYGNVNAPIILTIYQNNYFLRDFDPSGEINSIQNYFSKAEDLVDPSHNYMLNGSQTIDFDNHLGEMIYKNDDFKTNAEAIELWNESDTEVSKTFIAPALRISFESDVEEDEDAIAFWKETIIDKKDDPVLSNANNFRNYFRGLYFKAEANGSDGNMVLMNLGSADANVTIYYSKGEATTRTQDTYILNFNGNRLNTFINEFNVTLEDGDKDNGDETLYLKGLEGSMAVVDLFPTDEALESFKNDFRQTDDNGEFIKDNRTGSFLLKKLVNEAHLIIYEDDNVLSTLDENGDLYHKYDRIYAYDIKNNIPTIDYQIDPIESNEALSSKLFSLGQREESSGKYKIRITEHLNNIIQNDSTNYQIGLVLSNNVNVTSSSRILNSTDDVTAVPTASIISPRGTILNGNNAIDDNKKLKLKVFFTELKEN
ncbi:DUF4270 domain-containing protein [Algibacter sp.]|nr:DUF4270 domain-containing protein [Algibacter sp.]MDA9069780.1 DUF4270 domain-containing protein [Algibacter sp.]MDA9775031.1 DUF4270 domain-containing protein [Algibacter sp.]